MLSYSQESDSLTEARNLLQKAAIESLVKRNFTGAKELYTQAARLLIKEDKRNYLQSVKGLAECYEQLNMPDSALLCYGKLIKEGDSLQSDIAYLRSARIFKEKGNIPAAIQSYENGRKVFDITQRSFNETFYRIFYELFYLYHNLGEYDKSIDIGKELVSFLVDDFRRKIVIQIDLGSIYQDKKNDIVNARILFEDIIREINHYGDNQSANSKQAAALGLTRLAEISRELGNANEAINYAESALYLLPDPNGNNINTHFTLLKLLSMCYADIYDEGAAISYAKKTYDLTCNNAVLHDSRDIAFINLYTLYTQSVGYDKPELVERLLNQNDGSFDNFSTAALYNTLAWEACNNNEYSKAIEGEEKAIKLQPNEALYYNNLAISYSSVNNYEKAAENVKFAWTLAAEALENAFLNSREQERAAAWEKYKLFIKTPSQLIWQTDNQEIHKYAYNSVLLTKGIRLASINGLRNAVMHSDNEIIKNLYHQWQSLQPSSAERNRVELQLLAELKKEKSIDLGFSTRWDDVRNALNKDDVAIEFFRVRRTDTNEDAYLALLLRNSWDAPKSIFISLSDLSSIINQNILSSLYSSDKLGEYIWKSILHSAYHDSDDIKNIYFAPDGILHNIAIENLMFDGKRLSDIYNIHRLSSTRDLVYQSKARNSNSIALFGGIDYDTSSEELEFYASNFTRGMNDEFIWNYLPGTKEEIEDIQSILNKKKFDIKSYSGEDCIEETFKQYDNTPIGILHFATHGFYLPDAEHTGILDTNINSLIKEDESLMRCGLAFAGANNTPIGELGITTQGEDGILTGLEISSLNLSDTDIVVLSACQTALGDINDEGVFGLQRAFKKAGAKNILMSLWNVDDKATHDFMTAFYLALADGATKQSALMAGREFVMGNSYLDADNNIKSGSDPYFWAGFILLE